MKIARLFFIAALLPALAQAWPWSQDMMNQPSIKPEEVPAGHDGMLPFALHSVPVQGVPTKVHTVETAQDLKNPIPATPESISKGRVLFRIICAACHGLNGEGVEGADTDPNTSPVAQKIGAANLVTEYVQQQLTEGWIWGTISFGSVSKLMPPYGVTDGDVGSNDLTPEERWHVVNYVRHLLANEPKASAQQASAAAPAATP